MTTRATRLSARAEPDPAPGGAGPVVLGRYRLRRHLGAGAFGSVWRARDQHLERDVAVKILPRQRIVDGRFEREARATARLSHPAIVTLYEAAVDDDGAYLVSELVEGSTLAALLADGRLSDRDILEIGTALCDALEHAHAQGVVHRDVKPSNVLVPDTSADAARPAKLTDFGVARIAGGDALTRDGDVVGTLDYMAPEQAGGLPTGPAADLYSLALVLYEALTGVPPRPGARPAPLRRQRRDLPHALGDAIDGALHPDPARRGSPADLRESLAACLPEVGDELGIVAPPTTLLTMLTRREGVGDAGGDRGEAHTPEERWEAHTPEDRWEGDARGDWREAGISRLPWLPRATAAAATAVLTAWLAPRTLGPLPLQLPPITLGLAAGAAALIVPRLAWLALTAAVSVGALVHHHPQMALATSTGLLLPAVLLPRRPSLWPLAAAAPALGLIGLAGAYPALAGRAAGPYRRAALGALGWSWLLLAPALVGRVEYIAGLQSGALGPWAVGSAAALAPAGLWAGAALAPAAVWAGAALVLPWLIRGRRTKPLNVAAAAAWAALTAVAVASVGQAAASGATQPTTPHGLVIGAIAAAVLALVPRAGSTPPRVT